MKQNRIETWKQQSIYKEIAGSEECSPNACKLNQMGFFLIRDIFCL